MPKYENSIIYKLCHCNDLENENIYIGSTTNFRQRKCKHKNSCNNEKDKKYNYPVYQFIRENGRWDEWQMVPIEVYPCNNINELEIRERYHIELLKSKLNKVIPTRTKKEHYEANKEILAGKQKKKYEANKEKIAEKAKDYYEANKDQILENKKKYRKANKQIISEKRKQKVICDHCGSEITKNHLKRHQKSKKCIEF